MLTNRVNKKLNSFQIWMCVRFSRRSCKPWITGFLLQNFWHSRFQMRPEFFHIFFLMHLFLVEGWLLYCIGLISAIHQHKLAIGVHVSPPSVPPTLSQPSRLLPSSSLSSLSHTANFHWLSILHMVVNMLPCFSLHSSYPLLPAPRPCPLSLLSTSASPLLPCK